MPHVLRSAISFVDLSLERRTLGKEHWLLEPFMDSSLLVHLGGDIVLIY